jgi:hypothetical protein
MFKEKELYACFVYPLIEVRFEAVMVVAVKITIL